jgi:hypothetical protein
MMSCRSRGTVEQYFKEVTDKKGRTKEDHGREAHPPLLVPQIRVIGSEEAMA